MGHFRPRIPRKCVTPLNLGFDLSGNLVDQLQLASYGGISNTLAASSDILVVGETNPAVQLFRADTLERIGTAEFGRTSVAVFDRVLVVENGRDGAFVYTIPEPSCPLWILAVALLIKRPRPRRIASQP